MNEADSDPPSREYWASLPKSDLHVHLEGCVTRSLLLASSAQSSIGHWAPESDVPGSFDHFIRAFKAVLDVLTSPDRYRLAAELAARTFIQEQVRYAEVFLSAGQMVEQGLDLLAIVRAVHAGFERGRLEHGLETRFILDVTRHHEPANGRRVLEAAVALRDVQVVGLGLGGDERRGPVQLYADMLAEARAEGLFLSIHAGEVAGAESVRAAMDCGAQRIGHGVRAADDDGLLAELASRKIAVEVCPTSNVCTGSVANLESHPVRRLVEAGVPIVVGSDDPAIFGTSTSIEYALVSRLTGIAGPNLTRSAAAHALLPTTERAMLAAKLEGALLRWDEARRNRKSDVART